MQYICKVNKAQNKKKQNEMKSQKIKIENYSVNSLSQLLESIYKVNSSLFKIESDIRKGQCIRKFYLNNKLIAELDITKSIGFYKINEL